MTWRAVNGLISVERCEKPQNLPNFKPASKSAARIGIRYEKKAIKELRNLFPRVRFEPGPWFRFTDQEGSGYCQPDFIFFTSVWIILGEIKYTYTAEALNKIKMLYGPVVSYLFHLPIIPIIIVHTLRPDAPKPHYKFEDALRSDGHLLHWLGQGHIK